MKTLKFADDLVALILSGEKTSTWRLFDDKCLRVGDELSLVKKSTGIQFALARIVGVKEKKLGEVDENDFNGQEKFENKEAMLQIYRKYYGDEVDWNVSVKIIGFKLL